MTLGTYIIEFDNGETMDCAGRDLSFFIDHYHGREMTIFEYAGKSGYEKMLVIDSDGDCIWAKDNTFNVVKKKAKPKFTTAVRVVNKN